MVWGFRNPVSVGYLLMVIFLANCVAEYAKAADNTTLPETSSLQGKLQGVNLVTRRNRTVYGFKGIPFAEPPVGDLRWDASRTRRCQIFRKWSHQGQVTINSVFPDVGGYFFFCDLEERQILHKNYMDTYRLSLSGYEIRAGQIATEQGCSVNRFKAPVPAGSWNGTFNASRDSNDCTQIHDDGVTVVGDEDCLYLHVYTPLLPASDDSSLLPVMVFIFGGGFKTGTINPVRYGPNFLLDQNVVLVVPNYRLGVLGYLTTGDEVSPGNYGLKDIVLALEWVRDNIQYFGGDPNQVTLFGGSSGSMSVHLLTLSDLTEGLFHKYITESGPALIWTLNSPTDVYVNRTIQLAEYFGCPTNTSTLLVNCLRGINASQLIDTYSLFYVWGSIPASIWFPTVEPDIEGALLTDTPANLFAAGKIRDLPWITLVTRDEGYVNAMMFHEDADLFEEFLEKIDYLLPILIGYSNVVNDVTAVTEALKSYYLNDLTADKTLLLNNLTELLGDGIFVYPTYDALQQQLVLAENPQYFCSFEYRGVFSHTYLFSGGSTNYTTVVTHGDEIIYLFENLNYRFGPSDYAYSDADWTMVDKMLQLWTSFATNGTPTIADSNGTITWEPYSSRNNYLRIGDGSDTALEIKYDLFMERMNFWKELMAASVSGEFRTQVQPLSIALCLCILSGIYQYNCGGN